MRIKFILPALLSVLFLFSCEKETTEPNEETIDTNVPLTIEEINTLILDALQTSGEFNWKDVSDHTLWSAIVQGEGSAEIGYSEYSWMQDNALIDAEIADIKEEIIGLTLLSEQKANSSLTESDIVIVADDFFTHLTLKIKLLETITRLRANENIRFLEANYDKLEL